MLTNNNQHEGITKTLPLNAMVLLSHYLTRQSSFDYLQVSTNPSLTIKTEIAKDKANPKKRVITRTTTFKRRQLDPMYSFDSFTFGFEDRLSVNESRISDITTRNATHTEPSIFKRDSIKEGNVLMGVVRIQKAWRRWKENMNRSVRKGLLTSTYGFSKKIIYKDIIHHVVNLQRYVRKFINRKRMIGLLRKVYTNVKENGKAKKNSVNKKSGIRKTVSVRVNY
jgi:hypothetical protein